MNSLRVYQIFRSAIESWWVCYSYSMLHKRRLNYVRGINGRSTHENCMSWMWEKTSKSRSKEEIYFCLCRVDGADWEVSKCSPTISWINPQSIQRLNLLITLHSLQIIEWIFIRHKSSHKEERTIDDLCESFAKSIYELEPFVSKPNDL